MIAKAREFRFRGIGFRIGLLFGAAAVVGCDARPRTLQVRDAWSWPTAPGQHDETARSTAPAEPGEELGPGVAYFTIVNDTSHDDRLVSVRASICAVTELHETKQVGEHMRMVPAPEGVKILAGHTVEFKPGGLHIMLIQLHHDLLAGERFELVLDFEKAGEVRAVSEVRKP